MKKLALFAVAAVIIVGAGFLISQPAVRVTPGPAQGGGYLLNSGWKIQPAGQQVAVDTLPMSSVISKDGKYLLVLNGGYNPPSISVIDIAAKTELSRTRVPDAWLGLALTPKGDLVYVGGGSKGAVYEFSFQDGALKETRAFPVVEEAKRTWEDFIGDVALSPDGRLIYAADIFHNRILVINPQSGRVIERIRTGRRPYRVAFLPGGKSYVVSNWADGTLSQFQTSDNAAMGTVRTGQHPTDIVFRNGKVEAGDDKKFIARAFVAAANTNSVFTYGVDEGGTLSQLETINVAMTPRQPLGMTPSGLGLSADNRFLYIACSDGNTVAVADVSEDASHVLGFIPVGWYPTAVRGLADGRILVLNGKGVRSYPNVNGPSPLTEVEKSHEGVRKDEYVGKMQHGTASFIDPLNETKLLEYTRTVLANSPYRDAKLDQPTPAVLSKIKHVIYIVKENRTYDPMLGDMKEGNGDPSLVLFGEKVTPNQHKLAREFVLLDNFYVSADVSADGHNWSTAAIASDYVQKLWPNSYAARRKHYDYEGGEPAATPPAGYLWTNARQKGISMRNYGYFVENEPKIQPEGEQQIEKVRDPILESVTSGDYRGFDLNYPDVKRVKVFQKDLAEFETAGKMPQLIIMRLGNDHTSGTAAGKIAPLSAIADNDYALGMLVESVSKSKFWADTAIFVLEDDAQNGADHVDSHRSPAFVLSPYTRRGVVDSTMYNTVSMLRTIEMIIGLRPMTQFDAGASPMTAAFQANPNMAAYTAAAPNIPLDAVNPKVSATAARSKRMNFEQEDQVDDDELNEVLWIAIKGQTPPPVPVRSLFAR